MSDPKTAVVTRHVEAGRPARVRSGVHNRVVFREPTAGGLEMISATQSNTGSSEGFFTRRICTLMQRHQGLRFVEAARRVARQNSGGTGELAARSGRNHNDMDVATGGLPLRQALVLANANYRNGANALPDVAADSGPNGRLSVALAGDYGARVQILHDQTGPQMRAAVRSAITSLGGRLVSGQLGELMVNYQGHGNAAGMVGVDGQSLNLMHLQGLANIARTHRVQLIVVSDACHQGAGTAMAQLDQNRVLSERVRTVQGLSAAERSQHARKLHGCRQAIRMAGSCSQPLSQLQSIAGGDSSWEGRGRAYQRLGQALQPFRGPLRTDMEVLSSGLRGDLSLILSQVCMGDQHPLRSTHNLRGFCDHGNQVLDRLNEEVAQAQQQIQLNLSLRGLDRS